MVGVVRGGAWSLRGDRALLAMIAQHCIDRLAQLRVRA